MNMTVMLENNQYHVYLQLSQKFKDKILCGIYQPGMKLPSVRDLARENRVHPNTIQRALDILKRERLIEKNPTNGNFVSSDFAYIAKIRQNSINTIINDFIHVMHRLGYSPDKITALINECNNQ